MQAETGPRLIRTTDEPQGRSGANRGRPYRIAATPGPRECEDLNTTTFSQGDDEQLQQLATTHCRKVGVKMTGLNSNDQTYENVVYTSAGRVRGSSTNGIYSFKGIPYGARTSGQNRFLPPQPAVPWSEVRDATHFGSSSPQIGMAGGKYDPDAETFDGFNDLSVTGEDCLVLNVWTPSVEPTGLRPTMVWLHGGGLHAGTASSPIYDGAALSARGDTVVVTVNHRLGILGYLDLGPTAGERYQSSGMAGMLDIIAALEWVQENIIVFGGDPRNVTLFGQSGGAQKVAAVLGMPSSAGLLHRAIIQSGGMIRLGTRVDSDELTHYVLDRLAIAPGDITALQDLDVEILIEAAIDVADHFGTMCFNGVVDGAAIPRHPGEQLSKGLNADVSLMVGATTNEFRNTIPTEFPISDDDLTSLLAGVMGRKDTGQGVAEAICAYPKQDGVSNGDRFGEIFTHFVQIQSDRTASAKVEGGPAPVFTYLFDGGLARHCDELRYIFRWNVQDDLADQISDTWLAFARTGNPNNEHLPEWPPYTLEKRFTMVLGAMPHVEMDPLHDIRLAWKSIPANF